MSKTEVLSDRIREELESLNKFDLVRAWNEYCDSENMHEDQIMFMEDLDGYLCDCKPSEILDRVGSDFSTSDDFFIDGCYGMESFDDPEDHVDLDDLAYHCAVNEDSLYIREIEWVIDAFNEECEAAEVDSSEYLNYQKRKEEEVGKFFDDKGFFAYSNEQFEEGMKKLGLNPDDTGAILKAGPGTFILKSAADEYHKLIVNDDLIEFMQDEEFAVGAFFYEMGNHEYAINTYQGDWDVCSCFGSPKYGEDKDYKDYLKEIGYGPDTVGFYADALDKYKASCRVNGYC